MTHHLLGLFDSPYVRRVAVTLAHYGIPFTHESLSVFRHVEEMRNTNPLLRVPMLTTPDGMTLHESAFILDYLDELARESGRGALVAVTGPDRRAVWQATARAQFAVDKAVALHYEHRRPPELRWAEWEDRLRGQLLTALGLLEESLAGEWFVGDAMTHADVTAAVTVSFIRYTEPKEWPVDRYPRLEALTRRLEQTPAFLAVPIDRE